MSRHVFIAVALLTSTACLTSPETRAARTYVTALEPLLYENGFLADRVLFAAAAAHDGRATSTDLRAVWHEEVVPLADHLAWQASATNPPAEWSAQHGDLVSVWQERAEAYRSLDEAVETGNREQWREARAAADGAKIEEEEWFRSLDVELAKHGLAVDQFP